MKTVDENRRVLWLMHALMLLIAVPSTLLGALTPYFTQRFSLTYTQIGMLGSAQGIGGIVSMLAGGLLSDRMPKLRLAGWVLLLLTGSAAGLCIVDSYPLLILFLALVQFSANLLSMVISSYWCEQPNGSHQLSYGHALYGIGSLIGPLYAAGMVAASHEQSAFLFVGILGVALLIIGFPSFREKKEKSADAAADAKETTLSILKNPKLWFLLLTCFLYMGQQSSIGIWVTFYMKQHWNSGMAEMTLTLYWTGVMAGRFLLPKMEKQIEPSRWLTIACLTAAVMLAASLLIDLEWLFVVVLSLSTVGTGAAFPYLIDMSSRCCPQHSGLATTAVCLAGTLGGTAIPWLIGVFSQGMGDLAGIMVSPGCLLLCAAVLGIVALFYQKNAMEKAA